MAERAQILIVDDSEPMRRMLRSMLEAVGHLCFEASNGIEAMSKLKQYSADLIITDLDMPISSGIDLMGYLAGDRDLNSIPIIVCTARGDDPKLMSQLPMSDIHSVLMKPVSVADLVKNTSDALAGNVKGIAG